MDYFTLVFEGDLHKLKKNPFKTNTPFGLPVSAAEGDAIDELEIARVKLENVQQIIDPE